MTGCSAAAGQQGCGAVATVSATEPKPAVSVIIAFHKPDIGLARRQIDSILGQTGVTISGVAVIDGDETADDPALQDLVAVSGFDVVVNSEPRGVLGAFAAGLERALSQAGDMQFFCYADQDDVWHAEKLVKLVACAQRTGATLVHCDAHVVAEDGTIIAASLHRYESRREPTSLLGTLLLNSVTGMTCLFPIVTARLALDLMMEYDGPLLHDHITAIAATAIGSQVYLDDVLVDYIQHRTNQLGAKLHIPLTRRRALGFEHLELYRMTSRRIYDERRGVALLLAQRGLLPLPLQQMFRTGEPVGTLRLIWIYTRFLARLFFEFDFRRWMLGLRMMDAALFCHSRLHKL